MGLHECVRKIVDSRQQNVTDIPAADTRPAFESLAQRPSGQRKCRQVRPDVERGIRKSKCTMSFYGEQNYVFGKPCV